MLACLLPVVPAVLLEDLSARSETDSETVVDVVDLRQASAPSDHHLGSVMSRVVGAVVLQAGRFHSRKPYW